MSDEKLKACPIPGCGGAAVASPNKENARVVECSAQDCLTWLPVGLWQALPRASEAVLEVTREIKARLESNRIHPASQADLRDWIPRLESAAPGMGTPGEVWRCMECECEQSNTDLQYVICNECVAVMDIGTPQPKADAGECCICSGAPDTFACTECMDLASRANPAHLRSLERDADVLCTIRHRLGGIDNETLLIRVHPTDNAIAPQRPKAEAGSVWVKYDDPYDEGIENGFVCLYRGDKRIAILDDRAAEELQKNAPDLFRDSIPVIGAPSKGECEDPDDLLVRAIGAEARERELIGKNQQQAKLLHKAETARQTLVNKCSDYDTRLVQASNTVSEALQRAETAEREVKRLGSPQARLKCVNQSLLETQYQLSTIREQLVAAQRMNDDDSARLVEAKREKDALRDQLGEAERAKDTMSEYITRIVGGKDALAERVRELEGEAVVYSRRAHQREGSLKGELHRAFTGWNKEAREFKSFRDSLASGDQMRIEYGPTGKAALRYDSTLYNAVPFDAPTPPTTAEGEKPQYQIADLFTRANSSERFKPKDCPPQNLTPNFAAGFEAFVPVGEPRPTTAAEMPVCPKCGKQYPSHVEGTYYCDCDHDALMSTDEWHRYCAENTPCRVCGRLPSEKGRNPHVNNPVEKIRCSTKSCDSTWCTPADWLDNNKEMDDEQRHTTRRDADRDTGAEGKTPGQEPTQATAKEARDEDGQVASPRAEALKSIRTELERWHFSYPERERGGFGRCVALFLDWAEAWEADHE